MTAGDAEQQPTRRREEEAKAEEAEATLGGEGGDSAVPAWQVARLGGEHRSRGRARLRRAAWRPGSGTRRPRRRPGARARRGGGTCWGGQDEETLTVGPADLQGEI